MIVDQFIALRRLNWSISEVHILVLMLDCVEVVELSLVPIWQVPEDANILKCHVVPFVIVRVVRYLVVMDILAFSPCSSNLDQLALVSLVRT